MVREDRQSTEKMSQELVDIRRPARAVLGGTGITMLGLLGGKAMEYLSRIIVARSLGPEQFGTLVLAVTLLYLSVNLTSLGMPAGIARYISFAQGSRKGSKGHNASLIITGLILTLPLALMVALGYWVTRGWIADAIFDAPEVAVPLGLMAIALPLFTVTQILLALLRGTKSMVRFVLSQDVIGRGIRLLLLLFFLLIGMSLFRASLAYLLGFVTTTVMAILLSKDFLPRNLGLTLNTAFVGDLLSFSWPLVISAVLMQMGGEVIGALTLGYFSDPSAVGLFDITFVTANIVGISLIAVRTIFMPVFTELYAAAKMDEMKALYANVSRWIFYIALPATAFIVSYHRLILGFFGEDYADGLIPLLILSVSTLFGCVAGPTGQILLAIGRPKLHLFLDILYVVINLSLNVLLVPQFGVTGAALAMGAAIFTWNGVSLLLVYKHLRIQPFTVFHGRFLLVIALITIVLMRGQTLLSLNGFGALFIGATVMLLIVVGYVGFLSPDQDREFVRMALQSALRGKEQLA